MWGYAAGKNRAPPRVLGVREVLDFSKVGRCAQKKRQNEGKVGRMWGKMP